MKSLSPLVLGVVLIFTAADAQAVVVTVPPGYTDTHVGTISSQSGWGGLTVDAAGNIYIVGSPGSNVYKMTPGGVTSVLFSTSASPDTLSVALDGTDLYIGHDSSGQIYRADLTAVTPSASLFTTIGGFSPANDMLVAPSGWGAHGGKIIVANYAGVVAIDQVTGTVTTVASGLFQIDNLAFTPGGDLLVTDYGSGKIKKVSPTGTVTDFYTFPTSERADGLAIDPVTGKLYALDSWNVGVGGYRFLEIDAAGTTQSDFATGPLTFNGGWYPSMINFSPDGTTLYYGLMAAGNVEIHKIEGFIGTAAIPEPSTYLTLSGLILCFGLAGRWRKQRQTA